jgi:methyl-accepting chemotaxis protein
MANFSQNPTTIQATREFTDAFGALASESALDTSTNGEVYRSVARYYDNDFKNKLAKEDPSTSYKGASYYMPTDPAARILQSWYISDNSHALGEKLKLDRAPQDVRYNAVHAKHHPVIRRFLESFAYYDIFLLDTQGNLVYSVYKETDFATNFLTGPYRNTNFGEVVRKALANGKPGEVFIEDFKSYEPSYGGAAAFFGSPVFDGD